MKNSWQILTILLAIALVVLTFKIRISKDSVAESIDPREVVLNNIMTRTSMRSFTDQKISESDIEILLKAGMAAPTAGYKMPWELIVIDDISIIDSIMKIVPGTRMADQSQTLIVVVGSPELSYGPDFPGYWVQDCAAVSENILLAAHGMGLGATWCGAYPNSKDDRVGKMQKLLNLPENYFALNAIVLGYPAAEPKVKDKWKSEKVHRNKFKVSK